MRQTRRVEAGIDPNGIDRDGARTLDPVDPPAAALLPRHMRHDNVARAKIRT
ncbi:hypothetical protein MGSAQ_002930 [marine sediment metagenome]|uniref:Uncharacterized protein n=1 Tax=marine sediment metagenome TaxID=412755 RepID=A0A1B6NQ76_9ZZZZ